MHPFHDTFDQWARQSEAAGDFDSHAIAVLARDGIARGRPALRCARICKDVVDVLQPGGALLVRFDSIHEFDAGDDPRGAGGGLLVDEADIADAFTFAPGPDIVDCARSMVRQWEHDAEDARIARNNEEVPSSRAEWVRVTLPATPAAPFTCDLLYCGACNLGDVVDTDDAVAVYVPGGTLCDGCGERAP